LDVDIEHPVVTPAALAGLVHGIDRRFAGPVAIRACSHKSRCGTPLPDTAPGTDGRPPERCDPRPSGCPTGACHRLPSEYRPAASAEESSSLTTAGSRACRGCSKDQPRSLRSTVCLLQPLLGWPSHV